MGCPEPALIDVRPCQRPQMVQRYFWEHGAKNVLDDRHADGARRAVIGKSARIRASGPLVIRLWGIPLAVLVRANFGGILTIAGNAWEGFRQEREWGSFSSSPSLGRCN
jgi:hypothetical protein